MLIGVVSDTHGHAAYTSAAVRMLESLEVQLVIHCGDIGSPVIPGLFSAWPAHFVFGNVDHDQAGLAKAIAAESLISHGRFGSVEIERARIAFLHGYDTRLLRDTIASGRWDLVCYGHTHKAEQHRDGDTLVLNPGAIYRANPRSIAVVELPEVRATIVPI